MARASQRFPHRGGVSPGPGMAIGGGGAGAGALPPGGPQAALMSNHLTTTGGGRSGVAWPAATIPARVKKLSWDDDDPKVCFYHTKFFHCRTTLTFLSRTQISFTVLNVLVL